MFHHRNDHMGSVNIAKNKNVSDFRYNYQHVVLVAKCRFKVFRNSKTHKVIMSAVKEVEAKYGIGIKEFAFGGHNITQ